MPVKEKLITSLTGVFWDTRHIMETKVLFDDCCFLFLTYSNKNRKLTLSPELVTNYELIKDIKKFVV